MTELEQFIADAEKHQQFDDIPTLCAMLKAAIEGLRAYAGCCDGCTCGDGWSHDAARETLAQLNTLATEALGTKGASDEERCDRDNHTQARAARNRPLRAKPGRRLL